VVSKKSVKDKVRIVTNPPPRASFFLQAVDEKNAYNRVKADAEVIF
jgi:hypothetical protein